MSAPWQDHFRKQAESCRGLGSPFTAELLEVLADNMRAGTVADRIAAWPADRLGPDAVALRLAGGLHALVLMRTDPGLVAAWPPQPVAGATLWEAAETALVRHEAHLMHWLDSAPQTNEIRRSAGLILGAALLAERFPGLPLKLSELGASAGLNLQFDRYAMRAGDRLLGSAAPVLTLQPEWKGPLPPEVPFEVAEARGVDLNPLNPLNGEDILRLRSYIWADQPDRMARLDAALGIAEPRVDKGDAAAWLADRLARPAEGQVHVVYHTIAWQYFPEETKAACRAALDAAAARTTGTAPLAHLSFEADEARPGAALSMTTWPGGETRNLGRMDFHGRWLRAV